MADTTRIEELRRRVAKDPASIAFAQLAEEHRRAGDYEEAARVCRAGLDRHPTYLSARVTLGRALIELGQYDSAEAELQAAGATLRREFAAAVTSGIPPELDVNRGLRLQRLIDAATRSLG